MAKFIIRVADGAIYRHQSGPELDLPVATTNVVMGESVYILGDGTVKQNCTLAGPLVNLDLSTCVPVWIRRKEESNSSSRDVEGFSPQGTVSTTGWSRKTLLSESAVMWRLLNEDGTHGNFHKNMFDLSPIDVAVRTSSTTTYIGSFPTSKFRLGFECETQRLNNAKYGESIYKGFQQNKYDEWVESAKASWMAETMTPAQIRAVFPTCAGLTDTFLNAANLNYATAYVLGSQEVRNSLQTTANTSIIAKAEELKAKGEFNRSYPMREFVSTFLPGMQAHSDGTVQGPEIVTNEPVTYVGFKERVTRLFDNPEVQVKVDSGCSFHIHMSIKDWGKHGYHANLQKLMMTFLIDRVKMWPDAVVHRCGRSWTSTDGGYFKPHTGNDKYLMVAPRNNATWEFRLWGQISTVKDAMRCLHLTIAAYNWARKQMTKMMELNPGNATVGVKPSSAIKDIVVEEAIRRKLNISMVTMGYFSETVPPDMRSRIADGGDSYEDEEDEEEDEEDCA